MAGLPPDRLSNEPACWGYGLADEPGAGAFPELRKTVDAARQARPGKLAYINLYPNYAPASALGTSKYLEHLLPWRLEFRHSAIVAARVGGSIGINEINPAVDDLVGA